MVVRNGLMRLVVGVLNYMMLVNGMLSCMCLYR